MITSEAQQEDIASILDLQKKCYQQEAGIYHDFQIQPLTQTLDSIIADFGRQVYLKIQWEDKIIGSVRGYADKGTCHIGRLVVHPDFQNRGLGQQLMNAIEERFPEVARYELFTGHRSLKNLGLYQKLGYTEFRRAQINSKLKLVFLEKINSRKS